MFLKNRLIFGILSGWGAQIISLAIGVFTMPLFFRYLPKDELGVWMFMLGTGFFVNLADLGFSPVFGRSLAFELGKGDSESRPNYEGTSYYYSLSKYVSSLTAPLLFLGMFVIGGAFVWSLRLPTQLQQPALWAWVVFCFAQAISCRFKYLETVLTSHGEVGWQNWVQMVLQILSLGGYFVVLHFFKGGIVGLTLIVLARNFLNAHWLRSIVSARIDPRSMKNVKISWQDIKPHIRPAMDMFLISLGAFLVLNTDQYFIVQFLGPTALPDYAAAYRLVHVVFTFASTVSAMCIPFISRRSAAGDRSGLHDLLLMNTTVGMLIQVGAVSVIAVFGDHIIRFWLGEGHFVGWEVLWVFCIMLSLENHHVIFARFGLNSMTDPTWGKMSVLSGVINLILTFIGVQYFGLVGVALGTLISQLVTNNWYAVAKTLRIVNMEFSRYFIRSGYLWLGAALVLLVCLGAIRSIISSPLLSILAGAGVSATLCGAVFLTMLKNRLTAAP